MKWKKTKEDSSHGRDTGHGRGNLHQYESFKRRRSFTNLSMHCSGNLDLFLSCSTDLWTDGSSRMNASFHFSRSPIKKQAMDGHF
jgi:hypothetical protein